MRKYFVMNNFDEVRGGRGGLKSQLFGSIMPVRKRPVAILALSSCPPDCSLAPPSS